jgi:hypothetical protein
LLDGKKTSCWEYTISTSLSKEIREGHEIYRRCLVAHRVGEEIEVQYRQLLEERMQSDLKLMQLEAELAKYQRVLGQLRAQVQHEEDDGKSSFEGEG